MEYSYLVFKEIDGDNSGEIDCDEFSSWVRNNVDLQEFLLKYTGVQTFESAKRRFEEQIDIYKQIFDSIAVEFMGEKYA